ncbi:MAG: hypothetical protein C5B49_13120 [Bdellovibrio sp.]|nr:MAG: hypothetical protein C5B49_13120 [Bdellovibrio sp.]
MVMIDNSGSTIETDPKQAFRLQLLNNFFNNYQAKTNFFWGLSYFGNDEVQSLVGMGPGTAFGDAAAMTNAIHAYTWVFPQGDTPYFLALNALTADIQSDSGLKDADTSYAIVFMSDGIPDPAVADNDLIAAVKGIVGLKPNHVTFSTIYFDLTNSIGPDAVQAAARLQMMANYGGGQFANTLFQGANLKLNDIATVPPAICTQGL